MYHNINECKLWCILQKQTYLNLKHADVKERGQKQENEDKQCEWKF